jgi:hypothetical protein
MHASDDICLKALAKQPNETSDWSKFKFYASLVKDLHFRWKRQGNSVPASLVPPSVLQALMEFKLERPIFPNLKALTWSSSVDQLDGYIKLFLGTQLTFLSIYYDIRGLDLSKTRGMGSFEHLAPNLTSIFVYWPGQRAPQTVASTWTTIICGLKQITDVSCRGIWLNPEAIRHLATSSCTCLDLGNDAVDILHSIRGMAPTSAFPRLQTIVVRSDDMTSLARLIELLRAETLRIINVFHRTQNPEMETDIETLIMTLGERCSPAELTEVMISGEYTNSTPPFPLSVLAPLLEFRNITDLAIDNFGFDLDDDDMEAIAVAWPRLKYIRLCSVQHGHDFQPRVTLASLVTLTKHCTELRGLELILDIAGVDFTLLPPEGAMTPNRNVDRISLAHSVIGRLVDPAEIAKFLSILFPELKEVCSLDSGPGERFGILDTIARVLPANNRALFRDATASFPDRTGFSIFPLESQFKFFPPFL